MSIHWSQLPPSDQIFTHFEEAKEGQSPRERVFAVTRLRLLARKADSKQAGILRTWIGLEEAHVGVLFARRGLEEARLLQALAAPSYSPLLFCLMPDESALLVDGSHTYAAAFMRGLRELRAYLVPECIWRNFLVEGLPGTTPEELLASHSGDGRVTAETYLQETSK